mmetsp:Transcript_20133/g.37419  ORF Transcript_20133/g.37419 Transcript_20133/m.37419 type:complete len:154 (+) Transcript_20133:79-540(+)
MEAGFETQPVGLGVERYGGSGSGLASRDSATWGTAPARYTNQRPMEQQHSFETLESCMDMETQDGTDYAYDESDLENCAPCAELTQSGNNSAPIEGVMPVVGKLSEPDLRNRIFNMLDKETDCMPRPDYAEEVQREPAHIVWRAKLAALLLEF